jgi:uncharacterized protein (UPF0276 family)
MIERDGDIPPLAELMDELAIARGIGASAIASSLVKEAA